MYKSQYKQDQFLDKVIFRKKKNGFFIDIGAHDGVSFSNTYFFEKKRNWNGVCIEPNPKVYKKLIKTRNSYNYNVCIGNKNDDVEFTQITGYSEMLSGVTSKYDKEHKKRITDEIKQNGGDINVIKSKMIILDTIEELKNQLIDFVSIDTEGNELEILKSINFKKNNIKCIVVENNYQKIELKEHLSNNGFVCIYTLHTDQIFLKKEIFDLRINFNLFKWKVNSKIKSFIKK